MFGHIVVVFSTPVYIMMQIRLMMRAMSNVLVHIRTICV